jgi:hypothetical protein
MYILAREQTVCYCIQAGIFVISICFETRRGAQKGCSSGRMTPKRLMSSHCRIHGEPACSSRTLRKGVADRLPGATEEGLDHHWQSSLNDPITHTRDIKRPFAPLFREIPACAVSGSNVPPNRNNLLCIPSPRI